MKNVYLLAATICLCVLGAGLLALFNYAAFIENSTIHALAGVRPDVLFKGSALQQVAFAQPDLLPIYGSSELFEQPSAFQPSHFFQHYPTGFAPFEVDQIGSDFIIDLQAIAALGPAIRGKKVVLSFTPERFAGLVGGFGPQAMDSRFYGGLFSYLHANELVFSPYLGYATKQAAARRLLQYPDTFKSDPLLSFELEQLANDRFLAHVLYYVAYPLGRAHTAILELQDTFQTIGYLNSTASFNKQVSRLAATVDWNAEINLALEQQIPQSSNNPYGIEKRHWLSQFKNPPLLNDLEYTNAIAASTEWTDLELLLRICKELGAKPLLLGRPIKAPLYRAAGVSDKALQAYYQRLEALASAYDVPLLDFKNYQDDIYFGVDVENHTGMEGWVHVDQALDAFYQQSAN